MIKKILIGLSLMIVALIIVGFAIIHLVATPMEWGHSFNFENELGIEIDSLEINIGDKKTIIQASPDGYLGGNLNVPEEGYPHKVTFKIYSNEKTLFLEADSFNCYNCDGYHEYKLKNTGAEYRFLN